MKPLACAFWMEIPKPLKMYAMHITGKGPAGTTIAYAATWKSEPGRREGRIKRTRETGRKVPYQSQSSKGARGTVNFPSRIRGSSSIAHLAKTEAIGEVDVCNSAR